jgi:hypothetical protein
MSQDRSIRTVEDPHPYPPVTAYELGIPKTCPGCSHPATEHRPDGCHHRTGHCDICSCRVDVATHTAKITEIGES